MPTLKEFEKQKKKPKSKPQSKAAKVDREWTAKEGEASAAKTTRRPGRGEDLMEDDRTIEEALPYETASGIESNPPPFDDTPPLRENIVHDEEDTPPLNEGRASAAGQKDFNLDFPYSELVKMKFPKSFSFAEKLAGDWTQDGDFSELPVEPAIAQFWVAEGLRRAKKVEKKLDQIGVLPLLRYQASKIREKLGK